MPKPLPKRDTTTPVGCSALAAGVLGDADALEIALRMKALGDPIRVRLLSMILARPADGIRTCDMATPLGVAEPTVSHHIKQLREAGLVRGTRQSTSVFYRADADALGALCRILDPGCD